MCLCVYGVRCSSDEKHLMSSDTCGSIFLIKFETMDHYLLKCTLHDFLFLLGLPIAVGLLLLTTDFGSLVSASLYVSYIMTEFQDL